MISSQSGCLRSLGPHPTRSERRLPRSFLIPIKVGPPRKTQVFPASVRVEDEVRGWSERSPWLLKHCARYIVPFNPHL